MVLKEDITDTFRADLGLAHRFASLDLAPNEQLETGFSVLDRDRNLVRMDKLYTDKEILAVVASIGPANGIILSIDMPKSLSIPGRWRQEEIKMHPLRLQREDGQVTSRYEARGIRLYEALCEMGVQAFLYFNYWTCVNYNMQLPFRSRSSQGCRALQNAIEHHLGVKHMPNNLAPSSVLDSMVGAYASWSLWAGKPHTDYEIHLDEGGHRFLKPLSRAHLTYSAPKRLRRRYRGMRPASANALSGTDNNDGES